MLAATVITPLAAQAAWAANAPEGSPSGGTCPLLQPLVDAAAPGSVLHVEPCVYRETITIDKPLTLIGPGATITGRDAAGAVLRDRWVVVAASDVTVEGFTMRDASNDPQTGAVQVQAGVDRFTLRDCDLAGAAGANVSFGDANDSVVEDCAIHDAGQLGVHMGGDGVNGRSNVVRNNRIFGNNTAGFDPEWEAGGLKATRQRDLLVEGNEVRDNAGPGIWCDIDCRNIVVRDNAVHDNTHAGIFFEVGQGADIEGNRVWANGWGKPSWGWGAGILISSSGGARVARNVVSWNPTGISVISQDRHDWPHSAVNNEVTDNIVVGESGRFLVFWGQDWDGELFRSDSGNRGTGGNFWTPRGADSSVFHWDNRAMSIGQYAGTPVGRGATLMDVAERDAALAAAGIGTAPDHAPPAMSRRTRLFLLAAALGGIVLATTLLVVAGRRRRRRLAAAAAL